MPIFRVLLAAAAGLLIPATAPGAEPLTANSSGQGLGFEIAGVDRSLEVNGIEAQANGALGGLYAYYQRGAALRAEARVLGGSLEYDTDADEESASVLLGDIRATLGRAIAPDIRAYGGLGVEQLVGDSPFGNGDGYSLMIYAPVGVAKAAQWSERWRVLVTVEGRFLLLGRDEIDDIPGIGDEEFDRSGGLGFEVSAEFRNADAGISIEPYIQVMRPSDSDTENIAGTDVQLEETDSATGGVRATWSF